MGTIEAVELENHRHQIVHDMSKMLQKYRAIFGWDVLEIDESAADRLILGAMHQALDDLERDRSA